MTEYTAAIALAKRLITKKGRTAVSLYRPTPDTPSNVARPWKLDTDVADALLADGLHVLFLDPREARGQQGQFGFEVSFRAWMEMPDSLMPDATAVAYFIPEELGGYVPQPGDLVVTGSMRYAIMRVDPLQPGDEVVLYRAQLKE